MYKALIIGCGNMGGLNDAPGSGNEHKTISYAKALKENGNFELFYKDKNFAKSLIVGGIWGGEIDDPYYKSEILGYDVIIVAAPDRNHWALLKEIINYEEVMPKLVICEKPLCESVYDAEDVIREFEAANVPILLDYTRRFIPHYQELHKHGKAVKGFCKFNRGLIHTGTHAIDTFRMFGLKKSDCSLYECAFPDGRIWKLEITFEDGYVFKEVRNGEEPVPEYFDHHTRYVIDNAYNFLEGKEELKCTMYDGLEALKWVEELG